MAPRPGGVGPMIRRMAEADLPGVERVLAVCPEAAQWSPAQLLREAAASVVALVAESEGRIAGMAALRAVGDEAELLNLGVLPALRRHGLGRALATAVLEAAREAGAQKVFLEVRAANRGARAFYAALGFSQTGFRRNYYRDPVEDALVLLKVLN